VSTAAASKAVDRLVRRGFLRRIEDQADRRIMHVMLTTLGRRILTAYESARRRELESVFALFLREDLDRAAELLDRISNSLRELGFAHVSLEMSGYRSGSMNESSAPVRDRKQ
jgi:DNA-binding MarR family transcriptional regulator